MRIMGLDYGSKTVGVAISDALRLTAQAVETIERKEENKLRRTCATGGVAEKIIPHCRRKIIRDDDLVLKGLEIIYRKNCR